MSVQKTLGSIRLVAKTDLARKVGSLPDHAANKAAIRDHQKINRCCVSHCRRKADYAVLAQESFLGIRGERTLYSKCPLMCARHVDDYGLLDEREEPLDEGLTVVRLAEAGGVQ